jgi:hypothetical protein
VDFENLRLRLKLRLRLIERGIPPVVSEWDQGETIRT